MDDRKGVLMDREEAGLYYLDGLLGFAYDFDRFMDAARTLAEKGQIPPPVCC